MSITIQSAGQAITIEDNQVVDSLARLYAEGGIDGVRGGLNRYGLSADDVRGAIGRAYDGAAVDLLRNSAARDPSLAVFLPEYAFATGRGFIPNAPTSSPAPAATPAPQPQQTGPVTRSYSMHDLVNSAVQVYAQSGQGAPGRQAVLDLLPTYGITLAQLEGAFHSVDNGAKYAKFTEIMGITPSFPTTEQPSTAAGMPLTSPSQPPGVSAGDKPPGSGVKTVTAETSGFPAINGVMIIAAVVIGAAYFVLKG